MLNTNIEYILIRFGEMSTKKKNRKIFIKMLIQNIKKACHDEPSITLKDQFDRIMLTLNGANQQVVLDHLSKVFGIASYTPVMVVPTDIEQMAAMTLSQMIDEPSSTFKVETRRKVKNLPFISDDVNRAVAGRILANTSHKVDIHHPIIKIRIEVSPLKTYIGIKTYPGLQGMPVGVGGKALVLMSGGIDSPVAAYLMMKRGVEIECVHFQTPPYTSPQALEKVRQLIQKLTPYQTKIPLHIINFTQVQLEIYRPIDKRYGVTLLRRAFMKIATSIAQQGHLLALVTGDSIGQVASQTLESMATIGVVTQIPIIRPLITYDKIEIIELAKRIGTYDISIQPYEDCCSLFAVNEPKTKPRVYFTELEEAKCHNLEGLIEEATASIVTELIQTTQETYL